VRPLTSLASPSRCGLPRLRPLLTAVLLVAFPGAAQSDLPKPAQKLTKRTAAPRSESTSSPALVELQRRLAASQAARNAGNADAIAHSNRLLIALALRQMAHLRLVELALPQAIALYGRSLDFEDVPDTRVDLAVAYLQANRLDDSLSQAEKAILAEPTNARGWQIQGKAWMMKQNYLPAADSLSRALSLQKDKDMEVAYSLGICRLHLHEKEKAAAVFKGMEATAVDRGRLHVLFARAYRDADYMEDAARELKLALAINPKTPHAHYLLGLVSLLQSEWAPRPEIRQQFLLELQLDPRDFLSNYLLGAIDSTAKNFAESDHYLQIATQIDPAWPEPWIYLGLNANSQGDIQRAEEQLRKAIALTGTEYSRSNYLVRKAYFALGRILTESGRREEARPYIKMAGDLQQRIRDQSHQEMAAYQSTGMGPESVAVPDEATKRETAPLELGTIDPAAQLDATVLARAHLTPVEEQQMLSQEKRLRAVLGAGYNDLATSEAVRQQYDVALQHYQDAERWDPQFPGLMRNLGVAAARAQKYPEAVRALSQVLTANPNDAPVRAMLGMSYYMTDHYKETAETISPLGDDALKDPGLGYAWADSLVKQGQLKPASEVLDKLEKTSPSVDTLMLVGRSWDEIGDRLRAVGAYHHVLQMNPSHPKAHYYAGLAYIRADQPVDAATEFQAELALNPNDPDSKYHLGFAYLQQARRDEAAALFREVVNAYPDHGTAQYQLGKILMDEGKVKEAISHLEAAVRLSPQADYMHYQLQAAYRMDSRIQDADRELAIYKEVKARKRELPAPKSN
jgi:tetratricopeptide (TPR) repeat protein